MRMYVCNHVDLSMKETEFMYIYMHMYVFLNEGNTELICIYVRVCVYFVFICRWRRQGMMYVCIYIYIYIYTHTYTYTYMHACMYMRMCSCTQESNIAVLKTTDIFIYTCTFACTRAFTQCVGTYTYAHTYMQESNAAVFETPAMQIHTNAATHTHKR